MARSCMSEKSDIKNFHTKLEIFHFSFWDFFCFLSLITLLPWPWLNIWKDRGTVILEIPQFICKPEAGGNSVIPYCLEFLVMKWAAFIKKTNKQTKQNKPDPRIVKFITLKVKHSKQISPDEINVIFPVLTWLGFWHVEASTINSLWASNTFLANFA